MKKVIRRGVFETNSSSTHSLTLKISEQGEANEVEKGASFEIRSPLAKIVQMLGLIDNAEREYLSSGRWLKEEDDYESVKSRIVNKINEHSPELLDGINTAELEEYELADIIGRMPSRYLFQGGFFSDDEFSYNVFFVINNESRMQVLKFKDYMLDEYCKIYGVTMEELWKQIDIEAFGNVEIRDILKDEASAEQKLRKNMEINIKFKDEFKASGETDIVAFAKKYLITDAYDFKKIVEGRISCDHYFCNGCLIDCNCDFGSYYDIERNLEIDISVPDDRIRLIAKKFIKKLKFVGTEEYCGFYLEETGEIY